MADGPFPEHYEPFESPTPNPLHPRVGPNPAARLYERDRKELGEAAEFPYAATTYRLTEHFHYWSKHVRALAVLQPEQFVEIGEVLASQKGIRNGDRVVVRSKRGRIVAKAVVTKRIRPLLIAGKEVHTVGIPIHWGFTGLTKPGYLANTLTPFVGDANVQTPEFKAFLVNVEKAPAGVA
jgi:formate dehydrogenase major subunit